MEKEININSDTYWNGRFKEDWESAQGPAQSRFFARLSIENLPHWFMNQLQRQHLTLCDWGCAQGDGTDVWANYVDSELITGIDFSSVAIQQATQRYPEILFLNENWLTVEPCEKSVFDVVFSSNTLEHFHDPYAVLKCLCNHARKALILTLPYQELDRSKEHLYTFSPENIPALINNGFKLIWSRVVNCHQLENTHWGGDQIVLVYGQSCWLDSLELSLNDLSIEQSDFKKAITDLDQALVQRDRQIASLTQAMVDRDAQIASLTQAMVDRDAQIASLTKAMVDLDGQIVSLNHMLAYSRLNLQLLEQSLSWQITKPLRWARILANKITWCFSRFESIRRNIGLAAAISRSISFVKIRVPSLARSKARHNGIQARTPPLPAEHLVNGRHQARPGRDSTTVLMLIDSFHDGGVERVVIDLCLQFRNSGRPCKILVAKDGGRSAKEARSHGIPVIEFHGSHLSLEQFLRASREGVVITHHCYFGLKQFHEAKIPIVEVIHNAYHWHKGNKKIAKYRDEFISKFVSVSQFVKDFSINELGINTQKIVVINNGLSNVDLIRPPLEILREKRLQTSGDPILLHVANLHPQKNHRLVVNAFAHVKRAYPKARLIIAGAIDSYPELAQALFSDIKCLGVGDSVQLAGTLDRRELSKTMAAAHIGLLPSMLEGFSIATLEFTFFGLPSVLSDTGSADDLKTSYGHIEIAEGCSLPPCNLSVNAIESLLKDFPNDAVMSLSDAILKILDSYPVHLKKSLLAAARFSEYAIEHTAIQYEKLLTSLENKQAHNESTG